MIKSVKKSPWLTSCAKPGGGLQSCFTNYCATDKDPAVGGVGGRGGSEGSGGLCKGQKEMCQVKTSESGSNES